MTASSPKTAQAPAPPRGVGAALAPPPPPPPPAGAPPQPPGQARVFAGGAPALLGVWSGRPLWPDSAVRRVGRARTAARHQLGRSDGDLEAALSLARRALEQADAH